jgi:hypothetical protein
MCASTDKYENFRKKRNFFSALNINHVEIKVSAPNQCARIKNGAKQITQTAFTTDRKSERILLHGKLRIRLILKRNHMVPSHLI